MSAIQDRLIPEMIPGVTEVVLKIRTSLERSFPFIWVQGEITDLSRSPSGPISFSLKDEKSLLRCVWFSWQQSQGEQKFNPLTGEVYENPLPNPAELLQNGAEVICSGGISFYGPGGVCQLRSVHDPVSVILLCLVSVLLHCPAGFLALPCKCYHALPCRFSCFAL